MKRLYLLLLLVVQVTYAQQHCDCEKEFLFVKNFIESNYAGFADKVTEGNKQVYLSFSEDLLKKARSASNANYCYYTIKTWLDYFKDSHIQLIPKPGKTNNDSAEVILLTP